MYIKQVSIFVENKSGKLYEIINLLGSNNIDISALSIADTSDYGILRLIVDNPNNAVNLLKENNYIVRLDDVIAITIDNQPGGLSYALNILAKEGIGISYLYAFVGNSDIAASVMLKVDDAEKAIKIFKEKGVKLINAEDIQK